MGILRRLREWREDKDGTLIGPNIEADSVDAGSVNTDKLTIRWDPNGSTALQTVIDNAPENARIVGDLTTQVTVDPVYVNTKGLTLEQLNLKLTGGIDINDNGFANNDNLLQVDADDVTVRECRLDGNNPNQDNDLFADCIKFDAVSGGQAIDCYCINPARHGIDIGVKHDLENNDNETVENVTVQNCYVTGAGDDSITTHYANGIAISGCVMEDSKGTLSTSSEGVEVDDGSENVTVSNCIARNCTRGYVVKGHQENAPAQDVTFTGCVAIDSRKQSFWFDDPQGNDTARNVRLDGCLGADFGVDANQAVYVRAYDDVFIDNCYFVGGGILVDDDSDTIDKVQVSDTLIDLDGNGNKGINCFNGTASTELVVAGTEIRNGNSTTIRWACDGDLRVDSCTLYNDNTDVVQINGANAKASISDSIIDPLSNGGDGVRIEAASRTDVANCKIRNASVGIRSLAGRTRITDSYIDSSSGGFTFDSADGLIENCEVTNITGTQAQSNATDTIINIAGLNWSDINDSGTRTVLNGVGRNSGDPSSTGDFNGNGYEGLVVRDTSNSNTYLYNDGSWSQIASA